MISFSPSRPFYVAGAALLSLAGAATFLVTQGNATRDSAGLFRPSAAPQRSREAPPTVAPLELLPIAPEAAKLVNDDMSNAVGAGPAAAPFRLPGSGTPSARAVQCLAQAVYYEAASESLDGQRAVAQVVLNRVRNPAFPGSVCGVVYQGAERTTGCQFTFTCDGSLARLPSRQGWDRARTIAAAALKGTVFAPVGNATHYHADFVLPYWAPTLAKSTKIGAHIFYRWKGRWGTPVAFQRRYSGQEPDVQLLLKPPEMQVAEPGIDSDELASVIEWSAPEGPPADLAVTTPKTRLGSGTAASLRTDSETGRLVEKLDRRAQLRLDDHPGELATRAAPLGELRIDRTASRTASNTGVSGR